MSVGEGEGGDHDWDHDDSDQVLKIRNVWDGRESFFSNRRKCGNRPRFFLFLNGIFFRTIVVVIRQLRRGVRKFRCSRRALHTYVRRYRSS